MAKREVSSKSASRVSKATQAKVLEGAAIAFGRIGYARVRVEDILEAAGVSRPTFYKLYASKDEVFEALSERHHNEIRKRIQAAADAHDNSAMQLYAMVEAFLRWRAGLGPLGRVLDLEARRPDTILNTQRALTLKRLTKLSRDITVAAGRQPADPVMTNALICAHESVADALLVNDNVDEAAIQRAINICFRVAAGALALPGDPLPPIPPEPRNRKFW